ncbi:hypothetical protein [Janthinobacterium sp. LB3P112]|uniref:hypothetical protein n=1 Tax=Janthinobacterium sp. LB3P112 TaxID=3424196 RepID=UPI003F239900
MRKRCLSGVVACIERRRSGVSDDQWQADQGARATQPRTSPTAGTDPQSNGPGMHGIDQDRVGSLVESLNPAAIKPAGRTNPQLG